MAKKCPTKHVHFRIRASLRFSSSNFHCCAALRAACPLRSQTRLHMYVIRSWKKAFRKIVLSQPLWNCNSEMVWWHDNTYFFSYRPEKRSYFWAVAQSALSLANLTLSTHLGILESERHTPWKCLNLSGHKMVFLAGESTPIFFGPELNHQLSRRMGHFFVVNHP